MVKFPLSSRRIKGGMISTAVRVPIRSVILPVLWAGKITEVLGRGTNRIPHHQSLVVIHFECT